MNGQVHVFESFAGPILVILKAQYDFLIKILCKKATFLAITKLKYHSKLSVLCIFTDHNNYITFN